MEPVYRSLHNRLHYCLYIQSGNDGGEYHDQSSQNPPVWTGIPLEQLIAHNLESLFPGMNIQDCYTFRVTRNADISVDEDDAEDLLLAIEHGLIKRRKGGSTVRVEVSLMMPNQIRRMLQEELEVTPRDIYPVDGMLGLGDLMCFLSLPLPELKDPPWTPVIPSYLRKFRPNEEGSDL